MKMDTKKLCQITSAANILGVKALVDLTSRAIGRMIEGKTPEEIREMFNIMDDLTEVSFDFQIEIKHCLIIQFLRRKNLNQ